MRDYRASYFILWLINLVFGVVILMLFVRLLFRLFGADPNADVVEFVYNATAPLLEPFRDMFSAYVVEPGNVFEVSTLVAIVLYAIFAWLLSELILFVDYSAADTYRRVR